jgi:hypothetical protein
MTRPSGAMKPFGSPFCIGRYSAAKNKNNNRDKSIKE